MMPSGNKASMPREDAALPCAKSKTQTQLFPVLSLKLRPISRTTKERTAAFQQVSLTCKEQAVFLLMYMDT